MDSLHPEPEELKELGNKAVQNQKFEEAILHYTHAIKLAPGNYTLYSNRSFAFYKVQQYYLALEDALETIRLNPSWAKGYFRKGEIEHATNYFSAAIDSYQEALLRKPDDEGIKTALNNCQLALLREKKNDEKIPWLGAGIGLIVGVAIVIADVIFTEKPTHPLLMSLVTIIISMIGYGIARTYRYYAKYSKQGLLDPPPSLDEEEEQTEKSKESKTRNVKYTKSQARQRYKKGKL